MKRSIQKRIVAIFAAALAVVIAVCAIFSYWSSYRIALQQSRDYGRSGAHLTESLISEVGLGAITDPGNTKLYQRTREELRTICKAFFLHYLIVPVTGALLAAFAALFILIRRRIIAPVRIISEHMDCFDPAQEPEPLRITSQDEMQQIADNFEKMSQDIRAYIENIERITEERAQVEAQMDAARRIQYGMVPATFHQEKGGAEVTVAMQPAKEVGGDFYDCFFLDSGELCAVIGDVSGKDVSVALFMAMAKSMLRDQLRRGADPAEALELVNDELCVANPEGMFATVFAFVLDLETGALRYANGGHNPPLLLKAEGAEYLRPKPGIALGLFEGMKMGTGSAVLRAGEGILLYTDGITEAVNVEQQFYGEDHGAGGRFRQPAREENHAGLPQR